MRVSKKERKKKKKIRMLNKRLVKKYPWLMPRNVWTGKILDNYHYTFTEYDCLGEGWQRAFGKMMLEDIDEELRKNNHRNKYIIYEVKEKYGCYDDKTEVLTKKGWKHFTDLSYEDDIATLNEDNQHLEYQKPIDIIIYKYKGKMYNLQNRGIDLCVTPNHNLYVAKGSYYNWRKKCEKRTYDYELTTPDKYFGKDKRFKKGGVIWDGEDLFNSKYKINGGIRQNVSQNIKRTYINNDCEFDLIPWLRFLGLYIAEGYSNVDRAYKNWNSCGSEICVAYNPYDEVELVTKLIKDIGFEPRINHGLARFSNATLARWLKDNCGHLSYNKKVPDFIKTLPPKYIEEFLTYLYIGDGHKTKTSNILATTSKQLSDDVQELLIKCGYCFKETIRDRRGRTSNLKNTKHQIITKHISYEINWLKLQDIEIDMSKVNKIKSFKEEWIDYKGIVGCVTVPNHIIYIRRNGKGVWCGNSLRWYDNGGANESTQKYEAISQNVCYFCGRPDTHVTDRGWILPVCKRCDEKQWRRNSTRTYEEVICDEDPRMADTYEIRRFSKDGDKIITFDYSDTTNKIRIWWNKNHPDDQVEIAEK